MPRIEAPTLAEHRDRRRASLLAAGRELALSQGGRAVTMSAVAASAGLSRTAVYEYFPSTDALLASLVVAEMGRWTDDITTALAAAPTPEEKVRTYVRASLAYVAEGHHRLAAAILEVPMPPECLEALGHLRDELAAPLAAALDDLGVPDAPRAAAHVHGVVEASTRRIEAGSPAGPEIAAAEEFALGGVRALA
jgi:AcrR family transcriptional regulator